MMRGTGYDVMGGGRKVVSYTLKHTWRGKKRSTVW